jgi:hypothetical protein
MSTVGMVRGKTARIRTEQGNGGGVPTVLTPEQLRKWDMSTSYDGGDSYVACRPMGWQGLCLLKRLKLAWGVFTGRYDVLKWPTQPEVPRDSN